MPIDVIKQEHRSLRDVLIRRLGSMAKQSEKTFESINSISNKLIRDLKERFSSTTQDNSEIKLSTPKNWADIVFSFGYKLSKGNVEFEDFIQGSGIQSILMFETLYLIDKDFFQQFGWKQAAIWAIEEPESSLHCSLEAKNAFFLKNISKDNDCRLQIFCTTHPDLVVQYAGLVCQDTI